MYMRTYELLLLGPVALMVALLVALLAALLAVQIYVYDLML
jgi:hypothetical protein